MKLNNLTVIVILKLTLESSNNLIFIAIYYIVVIFIKYMHFIELRTVHFLTNITIKDVFVSLKLIISALEEKFYGFFFTFINSFSPFPGIQFGIIDFIYLLQYNLYQISDLIYCITLNFFLFLSGRKISAVMKSHFKPSSSLIIFS